ncbi:disease resistance RPP13-like protein 4 [Chenopodium quinoa]|uniref:disease resistance RPP13-like protein 4 n=1 Tax=Chenopodium quinoa TaxID=63459 RepID=UPI000B78005D|nr:disease resistance RPP13-like protein 4 [Chenopodium quinoa]
MLNQSNSQSHVSMSGLSELAHSDRPLTFSDIMDLVIPKLLDITASTHINYSEMQLRRLNKFRMDLEHINDHFKRLKALEQHAEKIFKALLQQVVDSEDAVSRLFIDDSMYWQLEENLTRIKRRMPSTTFGRLLTGFKDPKPRGHEHEEEHRKLAIYPSGLNPFFESPAVFRRLTQSYELLDPLLKKCLLCFSAFPEGVEVNKRTVIYWWIGEQLVDPPTVDDGEKKGHDILRMLVEHGFLEEVIIKGRVTSRCRLRPSIYPVLIYLAQAAGFFYHPDDREYNDNNLSYGNKRRVYLVETSNPTSSSCLKYLKSSRTKDLKCIETLFNVNKCYMDIKLHWFWRMKNVKALYLGRCDSKSIQYIEVKSSKFLAGLKHMEGLRLLSLQGVSKIVKLPDSVGKVKSLRILDLRDCNDMEELPDSIKSLGKLTHLDLTGCYSLACLPKGISSLFELQVLKGFFFREKHQDKRSLCSFQDLKRLKKLRKLNITTSLESFPDYKHLEALGEMTELRKLTIEWQGLFKEGTTKRSKTEHKDVGNFFGGLGLEKLDHKDLGNFLGGLEKLDLQHIPYKCAPAWLTPEKLKNLKKLYIRGGKLEKLGDEEQHLGWEVETLQLLHLPGLSMTWTVLQGWFPKLRYLEQVKCDKLTSIPCNIEGVWQKLP